MMRRQRTGEGRARPQRVFVVDRHALMRHAAAEWINRCPALKVCGLTGHLDRACEEISRLRPDIVVTEIMRPHDLGFIRKLRRQYARLPILVFTLQEEASYGERAAAAGASGYLMKEAGGERLVRTIQALLGQSSGVRAGALPEARCERGRTDGKPLVAGIRKVLRGGLALSPNMATRFRRKGHTRPVA